MRNEAVSIFQQAVNEHTKLSIDTWAQTTAAVYVMCTAIVRFNTGLGKILYFASGQGKRKAGKEGGKRKRVRKE